MTEISARRTFSDEATLRLLQATAWTGTASLGGRPAAVDAGSDGAVRLDLSECAKAALERVRALADDAAAPGGSDRPRSEAARSDDAPSSTDRWATQAKADNAALIRGSFGNADAWIDVARRLDAGGAVQLTPGRVPSDDESFQIYVSLQIAGQVVELEKHGQPEKARVLRDAFEQGAIHIRKTGDVPGLNYTSTTTHFGDAGGGGTRTRSEFKPTAELKAQFDAYQSIIVDGGDRGSFYLTW